MLERFVVPKFHGRGPTVNIQPSGLIYLSHASMMVMGNPRYVTALIDRDTQTFGLIPAREKDENTSTVTGRPNDQGMFNLVAIRNVAWLPAGSYYLHRRPLPDADRAAVGADHVFAFGPSTLRRLHRPKPFRVIWQTPHAERARNVNTA